MRTSGCLGHMTQTEGLNKDPEVELGAGAKLLIGLLEAACLLLLAPHSDLQQVLVLNQDSHSGAMHYLSDHHVLLPLLRWFWSAEPPNKKSHLALAIFWDREDGLDGAVRSDELGGPVRSDCRSKTRHTRSARRVPLIGSRTSKPDQNQCH